MEAQLPFNWLMVASLLLGLMGLPAGDQTVRGGWRSREGKNSTLREIRALEFSPASYQLGTV